MEHRWRELPTERQQGGKDHLVFYRDVRFWLILAMLAAFLTFTLIRFP